MSGNVEADHGILEEVEKDRQVLQERAEIGMEVRHAAGTDGDLSVHGRRLGGMPKNAEEHFGGRYLLGEPLCQGMVEDPGNSGEELRRERIVFGHQGSMRGFGYANPARRLRLHRRDQPIFGCQCCEGHIGTIRIVEGATYGREPPLVARAMCSEDVAVIQDRWD